MFFNFSIDQFYLTVLLSHKPLNLSSNKRQSSPENELCKVSKYKP